MKRLPSILVGLVSLPALLACSPAADPVGRGGVHFQITAPTDPNVDGNCGLPSVGGIGTPPPELPVDHKAYDFGEEVTDGQAIDGSDNSYEVNCTVSKSGDGYSIDVTMVGSNNAPLADVQSSGEVKLEVHGTVDETGSGTGTVSVRTPKSGPNTNRGGFPCELHAIPELNDPDSLMIEERAARFTFLCKNAETPLADFSVCETRGTVSVRNCLK